MRSHDYIYSTFESLVAMNTAFNIMHMIEFILTRLSIHDQDHTGKQCIIVAS